MKRRQFVAGIGLFTLAAPYVRADNQALGLLPESSNVVFMGHALAPGFGDPENFEIGNCATQRNLDDVGRKKSRLIGAILKCEELDFDAVYTSQWWRCP